MEVKFQLLRVTLELMLRTMAYISEQLSTLASRIVIINLKIQDSETLTGESEVKFLISSDTLGAMLRSIAYIKKMKHKQSHYQISIRDNKVIEIGILSMPSFIGPLQQDDDDNMGMLLCLWTQPVY
ncbi:hypothetical protein GOBAR_AA26819 [Gossypium barbadense]|uniref:Uncharacterized protein n=1 Tax=Gossypium barbadense TaxID=3634 RepID=A0A2P5WS16_GOSBA|nr:hypothetical protein GOBAR_AA26819 [Gossypium barbadense]